MLAIAVAVIALIGLGLVYSIRNLVRGNRADVLVSAPLAAEQEVSLASAGEVLIVIEAPRLAADFRAFQIQLTHRPTGQAQSFGYSRVTAQGASYGVTTMQVPFGRMSALAGTYLAGIAGLQPGRDYSHYRLILSRPYLGRIALQVAGIVLCGVGILLSLIWAAWMAGLLHADHPG